VALERHSPDYTLLTSWQGLVIAPLSDGVVLRPTVTGFQLTADSSGATLVATRADEALAAAVAASRMSRSFDLPQEATTSLIRRMQTAIVAAAEAPPQSRALPRMAVAQSMLGIDPVWWTP
jgi:hypothetical protein